MISETRSERTLTNIASIKEALEGQYFYAVMGYTRDVIEDIRILDYEAIEFTKMTEERLRNKLSNDNIKTS